jgi:hypothetical protein
MNRRHFFRTAGALALPLFARSAFASDPGMTEELRLLTDAWRGARHAGRKVMVLVVPDDPTERWRRQDAWGEALTWGGEEVYALLGQVEVVCVRADSLEQILPDAHDREAWAFFVDPGALPARFAAFQADWEQEASGMRGWGDGNQSWEERRASEEKESEVLVAAFAAGLLEAAAAVVTPWRDLDTRTRSVVVARGRTMLRGALPGAMWSTSYGCGSTPDEPDPEDRWGFACGMGYVPARSERFVQFLAEYPSNEP